MYSNNITDTAKQPKPLSLKSYEIRLESKLSLRFFKRIKILPCLTLNISKTGISFSFGPRGLKYTNGMHGERVTVGLTGTGLYYTKKIKRKEKPNGQKN